MLAILCIFAWKVLITVPGRIRTEASAISIPSLTRLPEPPRESFIVSKKQLPGNPPATIPHNIGFMQIEKPEILQEYSIISPGKQWGGNVHSTNPGPGRLFNVFGFSRAYVVDVSQSGRNYDKEVTARFNADLFSTRRAYLHRQIKGLPEQGIGGGPWTTVLTEPLTPKECNGLVDGTVTIYFVSWCTWKDSEGRLDTATDCRWLQKLPQRAYSKSEIVWHYCEP